MKPQLVIVHDKMQQGYQYYLTAPIGQNFAPEFQPQLTPQQMLSLGVFGGRYLRDCRTEFPDQWFQHAKFHPLGKKGHDKRLNLFGVDASQPLKVWQEKGWIYPDDPRGWFQWYCRYYMGRRIPEEDTRQIKRWKAIKRHIAQIKLNCSPGDLNCRIKQRQAILHWAYDPRDL